MEVILEWATSSSGFWLPQVDNVAKDNLENVKEEKRESALRVRALKVWITTLGNNREPKNEANEDDGTGNEGLDGLMSLEPSTG